MTGTLINITTVLLGGLLGSFLGNRLPDKMRGTVMSGLGLVTAVVGMQMALGTHNILLVMGSVLVGGVLGEWWRIEDGLEAAGRWLEERVGDAMGSTDERSITRAFVTASLVFCVGPLTILGSIQDGLTGDYSLLAIKAMLDGFAALAFSATLGPGVILSIITILIYQGGLSLIAMGMGNMLGEVTRQTPWVVEMTAAGGVLILGISLILLDLRRIRVANMLPAIVIAPLAQILLEALGIAL
ncbi:MAG: DUF554 domain-containing protein [Chloroflexi bacterium]|nr:DUF554 domain-containing protein [Chloroflexota bacterium]